MVREQPAWNAPVLTVAQKDELLRQLLDRTSELEFTLDACLGELRKISALIHKPDMTRARTRH